MKEEIVITEAVPKDAEEVLEYLKIVGGETDNLSFGAEGLPVSIGQERAHIREIMESLVSVMYLARKEGRTDNRNCPF